MNTLKDLVLLLDAPLLLLNRVLLEMMMTLVGI
jgi:hypothetical protein